MLLRYPTRLRPSIIAMSPFSPCPPFPLQERPHTQGWTTSRITHADSIFMGWGAPGGHDSSFAQIWLRAPEAGFVRADSAQCSPIDLTHDPAPPHGGAQRERRSGSEAILVIGRRPVPEQLKARP